MSYLQSRGDILYKELKENFDAVGESRGMLMPYYYTATHQRGIWLSKVKATNDDSETTEYIGLLPWENIKKVRIDKDHKLVYIVVKDIEEVISNKEDCTSSKLTERIPLTAKHRAGQKAFSLRMLQENDSYDIYHKMHDSEDYAVVLPQYLFSCQMFDIIKKRVELEEKEEPLNEYELNQRKRGKITTIITFIIIVVILIIVALMC
ncbi:MAG: hypothetical protein IJ609_04380 [Paludibacteraceae bacterium]|nr:hypothetical protein [Paludibacteraceae bacterium]MBR1481142.1 hypothetical protein [Paludibacteraceae bacterium]